MSTGSSQERAIFMKYFRLPLESRRACLDRACRNNEKLRQRVERLIKVHDRLGDFLEEPAFVTRATPRKERPGDRIGHYKLLRKIGEGGWGIVFLAEQGAPVPRKLALKAVKPGMDTKAVIARFEAEREALALMDHPNIVHVFDAGATLAGRPFFVMEFVCGVEITEYCKLKSLATSARLDLFITICGAIHHAHQRGIIHRDIKPSNILIAETADGRPFPKIIDFGVAKFVANHQFSDETLSATNGMLIGTPGYMSPEQADWAPMEIDIRADVYSLGVLLYQLLTGTTPFDYEALLKTQIDEIRHVITTKNPVPPSARLSAMSAADLRNRAQLQRSEPSRLVSEVRGGLDCIVMKALEKNRVQRYSSTEALAMDVRRYLAKEPLVASARSL